MLLLLGATRAEHPTASAHSPLTPHSHTAAAQVSTTTAAASRAPTAHQDTLPLDPFSRFAPLNLRSKSKTSDSIRSSSRYRQHATALVGGPALSPLVLTPCWGATTGKTAFAVRQKIYRALSIGRTAKTTLCRAPTPRRTAPINARCRSLCRASLPRCTAKSGLCRVSDHSARQRGPGTCAAHDTAHGWGGR
jgi:hypothetical protein